jgi:hypothetical protein
MHRIKILLFLLFTTVVFGQSIPLSENVQVSVLTCGNGPEMYSLFGHTAIRVKDAQKGIDIVYNYGAFDFATKNFVLKFTKGNLQYFVTTSTFNDFLFEYHYEKRSVSEQVLDIPYAQKQKLFDSLNTVLLSNERYYTYKFIDRNCTNMAVDVLNKALGSKVVYKRKNIHVSYRETLYPYFNGHFYEQLGTSIIFGTKVDRTATLLFLPVEFQQSLAMTSYMGKPLAPKNRKLMAFEPQEIPGAWWNNGYTFLLLLIVVVVANKKFVTLFYLMVVALIGVFFSLAGLYSLHEELAYNYNALLFNPVLLLLIFFYVRNNAKWIYKTSLFLTLCIFIYLAIMLNKVHLLIVFPIITTNLILIGRMARKSKKELKVG